jgi:subfamily B ATP-binding cassette protein MsbA
MLGHGTLASRPLKRFPLFQGFDPRIKADLKPHRRTIAIGLACVLVTSLLDGLTIPLIERSFSSIQEAAPRALSEEALLTKRREELRARARDLAGLLGKKEEETLVVLMEDDVFQRDTSKRTLPARLAARLKVSEDKATEAVNATANKIQGNADAVQRLGLYSFLVILVFALKYWFTRGQAFYMSKAGAALAADVRKKLFAKIQRLPVSFFTDKRAGAIQSVLTNDVSVYQNSVNIIRDSIDAPIRATIAFCFILYYQWQLAAVAALFIPIMAFVIQKNGRKVKAAQGQAQDDLAEVAAMSTEALAGHRVVKAFAAESSVLASFSGLTDRSLASQLHAARTTAALRPLVELLGAGALAAVLYLCGWLSYLGLLQLGQIAALIFALDRINQGFRSLGNVANTYSQVTAASDRMHREVLDVPEPSDADVPKRVLPSIQGAIAFENVTFRYPDGTLALHNVTFEIPTGTSLALVGPSGAGKSTITDLLLRFYEPSEGRITLDGTDISELDPKWLREQFGVVPQHTFLFAGTIPENVRLGAQAASDEDVAWALEQAHAAEFSRELAARPTSELGESGVRLSGGQRQRVAIARAIVRKPRVLILDEATSALDAESEKAVTEALYEVMQDRTTLLVAHRLTTAARADRILVLRAGEVVETGSHTELMARGGFYNALFQAFSGGTLA